VKTAKSNIHGDCDPKFLSLKAVFEELFEKGHELGAGLAVTLDGKPVVNLWGGYTDRRRTRPWKKDTLVNVYSTK